jgi:hypothetical protein
MQINGVDYCDSVETLDSHKRLEHSKLGPPKPPAGVG